MAFRFRSVLLLSGALLAVSSVAFADDLLETLARKGVLTPEEYEQIKAQERARARLVMDDGLKLASGDGTWSVQVGTLQQFDYAAYDDKRLDLADGSELRRSRLSVSGVFLKDWQYRAEYEFATGNAAVTDAYLVYTARKPFLVTLGQFKVPFGLEALSPDRASTFMERALPFYLPPLTRAPGVMLSTSGAAWQMAGGVFGEPVGNAQAGDEGWGLAGRASAAPVLTGTDVVHLGAAVMWRDPTQDNSTNTSGPKFDTVRFRAKPESDVLTQRFVDTGEIPDVRHYTLEGLELLAEHEALSFEGEFQHVQVARAVGGDLDFSTWYAQFAWTLTGEARPYRPERGILDVIRPRHDVGATGWGAFELAARYSELDLTDRGVVGGEEHDATAALSWYLNPYVRVSANYVKVLKVEGGAFDGEQPSIYQMRLQLAI